MNATDNGHSGHARLGVQDSFSWYSTVGAPVNQVDTIDRPHNGAATLNKQ